MEALIRITDTLKSIKEARFSGLRSPSEFFDYHRVSKPADFNQATSVSYGETAVLEENKEADLGRSSAPPSFLDYLQRVSYNTRYFSGNYGLIVALLAVYAVLTNYLLLISIAFLVFGFAAINRFAPDATQFGEHTVTQKHLYTGLFVIGIPLLWLSSPIATIFWLIGASGVLILGHASFMEPGIESDYATIQETV